MSINSKRQHWFGPSSDSSQGAGHPVMFGLPTVARDFGPFPDGGGYPHEFLSWAYKTMARVVGKPCRAEDVLHLCSGSMEVGTRIDIRPEMKPTIVADCRATGLPAESFDFVLADPPYSEEYARNLYGTERNYPRPAQIIREACRVLRPRGVIGLMHFQVPIFRKPMELVGVFGISTGCGYAIRAWTLLQKSGAGEMLFNESEIA